jgi:hypothetical protein
MMSLDDARAWCDSPLSRGSAHQTEWAFFYTSVANFISCYWRGEDPEIDLSGCVDDGRYDEAIRSLGLKKIHLVEIRNVLRPYGVGIVGDSLILTRDTA